MSKKSYISQDIDVILREVGNTAASILDNGGTSTNVTVDDGVMTFSNGKIDYPAVKANTTDGVSYVINLAERFANMPVGDYMFSHVIDVNSCIWAVWGVTTFSIYLLSSAGNYRQQTYYRAQWNNYQQMIMTVGVNPADGSLLVVLYKAGLEVAATTTTDTGSPVHFAVNRFQLGANVGDSGTLAIDMDSVTIYKRTLSAGEALSIFNNNLYTPVTDGLVMNIDSRTSVLIDYMGNPILDQIAITTRRNGSIYNTFYTEASHSRMTIGKPDAINNIFVGGGTWEAWINPYSDGENNLGAIFSKSYVSFRTVGETNGKCKLQFKIYFDGTNGEWITTNRDVSLRKFNHVSVTYNADDVANVPVIEVNNIIVALDVIATPTSTVKDDSGWYLYMGDNSYQAHAFDGLMNQHKIYNIALTGEDKARNYNSSKSNYGY